MEDVDFINRDICCLCNYDIKKNIECISLDLNSGEFDFWFRGYLLAIIYYLLQNNRTQLIGN